jgi:predicted AAA+ superfamily ATPase
MVHYRRRLSIELPERQSAFLWGPRRVGKTTLLKQAFPDSIVYDLLKTDIMLDFLRRPALLREQLLAQDPDRLTHPVILDEIQKVPALLDEVHWLIENRGYRFILCGSSARKLKRGHGNLLGGRAWRYELFPLVTPELGPLDKLDLLRILNRGTIPDHYNQEHYRRSLAAYVTDYLKQEVFDEGLTRKQPAFSRFFDAIGPGHGQLTNFANIARDCGIDAKTVKAYYQILVDTLLGRFIQPFSRRTGRQVITKASKFYLFDVGIAGHLTRRSEVESRGADFGRAFEHFILTELVAHASYSELHYPIRFWRTKAGLEVDFILGDGEVAVEVKSTERVDPRSLRPIKTFVEEHVPRAAYVVCNEPTERVTAGVRIMPWRTFLASLWADEIMPA